MRYDFTDEKIRHMVELHFPQEIFTGRGESGGVCCDTCSQPWPCASIIALREWEASR